MINIFQEKSENNDIFLRISLDNDAYVSPIEEIPQSDDPTPLYDPPKV
jgi:hypothetical protein